MLIFRFILYKKMLHLYSPSVWTLSFSACLFKPCCLFVVLACQPASDTRFWSSIPVPECEHQHSPGTPSSPSRPSSKWIMTWKSHFLHFFLPSVFLSRCTSPALSRPSPAAWPSLCSVWAHCVRPSSPASTESRSTETTVRTWWLDSYWAQRWLCFWWGRWKREKFVEMCEWRLVEEGRWLFWGGFWSWLIFKL